MKYAVFDVGTKLKEFNTFKGAFAFYARNPMNYRIREKIDGHWKEVKDVYGRLNNTGPKDMDSRSNT